MKKFLSLVLALVMTMSLVTISAGAKEFTDDDTITYDEAINVISTIGVVDGYADGSFRPTDVLTRGAAAKIICNLILGPTTAAELHATTAPFKDVPTSNTFAGYIAYCAKEGIISGYADGTFRPSGTLTGYAFMKMLLGALNYDAEIEGYTGANWSINVAKQALAIGLNKGLEGDFNGVQAVTRQDACLYAFNTLKADLVEYDTTISATINGETVKIGSSLAKAQQWNNSATRINNIKNDNYIQFAEQYFNKLVMKDDNDVFGRPAVTWVYDKKEIGTYVDYTTLVAEYTEKITGKDLYDEITKSVLDDSKVLIYIDGETEKSVLGSAYFTKGNIVKTNTEKVGKTGNGVLTQVFVDTDADEVIIAIINTYLAKATEDYDEKDEEVELRVWSIDDVTGQGNYVKTVGDRDDPINADMTIELEDFAIAEDVEKNDLFLVTVADGEIQTVDAPEIISEATITNFKLEKYVTADGEQYDEADTAQYDVDVLWKWDNVNMKEVTYNVILDPYGYMIGLEQNEDPDQYVFLTGIDDGYSNLSNKNVDANVIFLDGTMDTVTIKSKDSVIDTTGKNLSQVNTWCTYTVDKNGIYTLTEVASTAVAGADVFQSAMDAAVDGTGTPATITIDNKHVSLKGSAGFNKVYGNDETVYLNVELENIIAKDRNAPVRIIDDVESVAVGAKNVKLSMINLTNDGAYAAPVNEVYALFDDDAYVIAAVTIGENEGTTTNYAYIIDGVKRESYDASEDEWIWEKEAIVDGKVVTLTEVGDHYNYLSDTRTLVGHWYEIRYDANGNVRRADAIPFSASTTDKFVDDVLEVEDAVVNFDTVLMTVDYCTYEDITGVTEDINAPGTITTKLTYENGTLYTSYDDHLGFDVAKGVKVVLCLADSDNEPFHKVYDEYEDYEGLISALNRLEDKDNFDGFLSAIFEGGSATTIILNEYTASTVNTGVETTVDGLTLNNVTLNRNGTANLYLTYARPAYVPDDASVTLAVDVYADGVFAETVPVTIAAGSKTARVTTHESYDEDEVITLGVRSATPSAVKVKYVDENGKDITSKLNTGYKTKVTTNAAGENLPFTVKTTATDNITVSISGQKNHTTRADTYTAIATASWEWKDVQGETTEAVVITISGLSNLTELYSVTDITSTALPNTSNTISTSSSRTSGIPGDTDVIVTATLGTAVATTEKPLEVTLTNGAKFLFPNDGVTTSAGTTITVDGDETLQVASVKTLDVPTITGVSFKDVNANGLIDNGDIITLTFSEAISAAPSVTATGAVNGTATLSADKTSATYTLSAAPTSANDKLTIAAGELELTNKIQSLQAYEIVVSNAAGAADAGVSLTKVP